MAWTTIYIFEPGLLGRHGFGLVLHTDVIHPRLGQVHVPRVVDTIDVRAWTNQYILRLLRFDGRRLVTVRDEDACPAPQRQLRFHNELGVVGALDAHRQFQDSPPVRVWAGRARCIVHRKQSRGR